MKRTWIIEVKLAVEDSWIADGFDMNAERLIVVEDMLSGLLPYAYGHEFTVKAKVIKSPDKAIISRLQGE